MIRYFFTLYLVLLIGCSQPNPPNNSEIKYWFQDNYGPLTELVELGEKHKALRRAEPAMKKYTDYYGQPSEEDLLAEERVFELVELLGVDFVAYWRAGEEKDSTLQSMSVPYYRWGLSLGGLSKSLVYFPNYKQIDRPSSGYSEYMYLNKPGWFLDVSDTR